MPDASNTTENPVSGERVLWLKTAADTDGELLEWEHTLRPGAHVPRDHIHAVQEERFQVIAGTARVRLGNELRDLNAGESIVIPRGTAHGLYNTTDAEARVRCELLPAKNTKAFFEITYALAREGKVDKMGVPSIIRLAVILSDLGEEHYQPGIPIAVQKLGLVVLAPIGRLLGYRIAPSQEGS
ncbi:MAG: cupin domain-containing protein [Dehalococcoidia bacterium]